MKKELSSSAIYSYALSLYQKGELTNEKKDTLFSMLIDSSVKTKDMTYINKYIKTIPGISYDRLIEGAIKVGNKKIIIELLKTSKGAYKERLLEALIKTSLPLEDNKKITAEDICKYITSAQDDSGEISFLIDMLIQYSIKEKTGYYLYELAHKRLLPLEKFEDYLVYLKDPKSIYSTITNLKEVNREKLIKTLGDINSAMYVYFTAMFMDNPPLKLLEDALVRCDDAQYIYSFALDIEGASHERIATRLLEIGNIEYIEKSMSLNISISTKLKIARFIVEYLEKQEKKTIKK